MPEKAEKKIHEKYTYEIQGVKLTQKPLKIRQVRELLKLISSIAIKEDAQIKDIKPEEFIDLILDDRLREAMTILFDGKAEKIKWDEVDYDQVEEIVNDFLPLNPRLITRLKDLLHTFGLTNLGAVSTT